MNRFELLGIIAILTIGTVIVLKSQWFDRSVDWLIRGNRPVDASDLKNESSRLAKTKEEIAKDLADKAAQIQADQNEISKL